VFREANVALLKSLTPVAKMFAGHDLNHFHQIERILDIVRENRNLK
jgi:hypothetical protein